MLQRWLTMVLIASVLCWMLGVWRRGAKLTPAQIDPALHQNPKQTSTERKPFHFRYRKVGYQVKPVANYELWGLVMSHNNIRSWWDVYHDADSVDTKDLCVIWGKNVKRSDFRKASFRSGAWTCYVRWPGGTQIFPDQLSNNHLVTRTQAIRRMIAKVRIGDQVHIKGMLVNYKRSDSRSPFWRRSSLSRKDEGNTACEVVFVEELRILVRGTPFWYFLASLGFWLFVLSLLAKFGVVVWRSRADRRPEHV